MKFSNNKRMKTKKVQQEKEAPHLKGQSYQGNPDWKDLEGSSLKVEQLSQRDCIYTQRSGIRTAVLGSVPYQLRDKAGRFCKIDNSVVCERVNAERCTQHPPEVLQNAGGEYYRNRFNAFFAYFPKLLDKNVFTMTRDQYAVAFALLDEQDNDLLASTGRLKGCFANRFGQTAKTSAGGNGLLYPDFEENSDLEYCVQDEGVKENIILHSGREQYRFAFVAELTNLEMKRGRDGSILLVSTMEEGKEVFRIPAPVMYDAKQRSSGAIRFHCARMAKGSNRYLLVLNASEKWINSKDRAFPVVIDPQVNVAMDPNDFDASLVSVEKITGTYIPTPPTSGGSTCPDDTCPDDTCPDDDIVCGDGNDPCCDGTCGSGCCDDIWGEGTCGSGSCGDCNCDHSCGGEDIVFGGGTCGTNSRSYGVRAQARMMYACDGDSCDPDYENNFPPPGEEYCPDPTQPGEEYCPGCEIDPTQPGENVEPPVSDPYPWQKFIVSRYDGRYSDLKFTIKNPMSAEVFAGEEIRVLKASLLWPMYQMNGSVHFQIKNTANGRVLEDDIWVNREKPADLYIDVTSVLNDMIREKTDSVELLMTVVDEGKQNEYIMFKNAADSLRLLMDYISQREVEEKSEHYEFEAGSAGGGNICLSTGKTVFAHTDMTAGGSLMPIPVSHVFSSQQKGLTKGKIGTAEVTQDYGMGKGWKLNVQQSLIVPGRRVPFRSESAMGEEDRIHYIDAEGNDRVFETKYYYMENGCKVFVEEEELLTDDNGEPIQDMDQNYAAVIDDVKHVVYRCLMTGNGLQLTVDASKTTYFNEQNRVRYYIENGQKVYLGSADRSNFSIDVYQVNYWGVTYCADAKCVYRKEQDGQSSYKMTIGKKEFDVVKTSKTVELKKDDFGEYFEDTYLLCSGSTEQRKVRVFREFDAMASADFSADTLSDEMLESENTLGQICDNLTDLLITDDNITTRLNELRYPVYAQYRLNQLQRVPDDGENIGDQVNQYRLTLKSSGYKEKRAAWQTLVDKYQLLSIGSAEAGWSGPSKTLDELSKEIEAAKFEMDMAELPLQQLQWPYELQVINRNKEEAVAQKMLEQNRKAIEAMLKRYAEQNRIYGQLLREEKQHACDIITDDAGNKLAFDFYGRLVAVQDASENTVAFFYDEEDQLVRIVNDDERESLLQYDKNGSLTGMTDVDGRLTAFVYNDQLQLSEIRLPEYDSEHPDARICFAYDASGALVGITDRSGYGLRLTYGAKTVTLEDYTKTQTIDEDGIQKADGEIAGERVEICFDSAFLTTVKTRSMTTAYQFDLAGNLVASHDTYEEEPGVRGATCVYREPNRTVTTTVGEDAIDALADTAFPLTWSLFGFQSNGDGVVTRASSNGSAYCYISRTLSGGSLKSLGECRSWVLSALAKADSAQIDTERVTGEEEKDGLPHVNTGLFDEDAKRKFGISASVTYTTGVTENFYASFDWYNTDWQLCQLPVLLNGTVRSLTVQVRYDYNYGTAAVKQIQLLSGSSTERIYSGDNKLLEESDKTYRYTYAYNGTPYPVKVTRSLPDGSEPKVNQYGYNSKHQLLWSEDYNGMVTEHTYDEKGHCVKTVTYHESDPSSKFYTESVYDEEGRETERIDPRGTVGGVKLANKKTYLDGTDTVKSIQRPNGAVTEYGYHHLSGALVSVTSEEDGVDHSNRTHLRAGYAVKVDNPAGMWYNYVYDGFGRVLQVAVNGKPCVSYTHSEETGTDGKKRLVNTATLPGCEPVTTVTDLHGRIKQVSYGGQVVRQVTRRTPTRLDYTETLTGGTKRYHQLITGAAEDSHTVGSVKHVAKKDGEQRVTESRYTFGETLAQKYAYTYDTGNGQLTALHWNDGLEQRYTYDVYGRPTDTATQCGTAALNCRVQYLKCGDHMTDLVTGRIYKDKQGVNTVERYGYNAAGLVETVTENGKLKVRYTYDKLDRLIREDNKALCLTTTFLYDNGGNLLCQREFEYGLEDVEDLLPRNEILYGYANADRPDQLTSFHGEPIAYNAAGMPTTYRGNTCTYTRGTLLQTFGENTFVYDSDGLRTGKNDTVYTYLDSKLLREVDSDNNIIDFIYGAEGILGISYNNAVYLFRKNVFGDVTHIYDTEGNLKARYIYDAWGNHKIVDADADDPIGEINPIRYRSYYYDNETGLYYLRARYYDPETGRFISQDNISYLDPENLTGLNLYAYCNNNPVMYADANGHAWYNVLGWIGVGLVVAAAVVLTCGAAGIAIGGAGLVGAVIHGAAVGVVIGAAAGAALGAAGGAIYSGITGADLGSSVWAGVQAGFGIGAIAGAVIGGTVGGVHYGIVNNAIQTTAIGNPFNPTQSVQIGVDPNTLKISRSLHPAKIRAVGARVEKEGMYGVIEVMRNGSIIDGNHRVYIARLLKIAVDVIIK